MATHTVPVPLHGTRVRTFEPAILLWVFAALVLAFMVVVPLGWLVYTSFHVADGPPAALTLSNYVTAFTKSIYLRPILNSMVLALSVATIATAVAAPIAWFISRTDMPARGMVRALIIAAFVTPAFLGAQAWIFLAAPNSGWLNRLWVMVFHSEHGPLNIYSLAGAIFVMSLYSLPYAFTFIAGSLELMSSEIEDSASTLGASPLQTTLQITLPLAAPAIGAGFVMSFLEVLSEFGTPAFLLIPAREQVMTTQLYLFFQFPVRVELAAAYAMPLLLVTMGMLYVQRVLLGKRRFITVTGKGANKRPFKLGAWGMLALAFCLIPPLLAIFMPYGALLLTSLMQSWGNGFVAGNFTTHWYHWALVDNAAARSAIIHSISYGAAAATVAVIIAVLIAYISVRKLVPGSQVLGFLCMAPFVVPGIVLAIGFISAYSHRPFLLYGTAAILIVAFATRFLPIAYSNLHAILQGINTDLENAARTLGAGRIGTLWSITAPLLRRGVLAGWLLVFIPAIRELSCAIFLFTPRTATMTTVLFDFSDAGNYEAVSTMGILIMALTLGIVVLAYRLFGRDFMSPRQV